MHLDHSLHFQPVTTLVVIDPENNLGDCNTIISICCIKVKYLTLVFFLLFVIQLLCIILMSAF